MPNLRIEPKSKSIENSNNQDFVREQLANIIDDYFDNKLYEVIVGMSNTEILGGKEIDIPIIVYNTRNHKVFRFAVEHDAEYFHVEERDTEKKLLTAQKGWHYIGVTDTGKRASLEKKAHEVCEEIRAFIENNE